MAPERCPVCPPETRSLQTQDDLRLDADVYYPAVDGEFPVLLMRQPYGRSIASTVTYAHPSWYASHGYIVVVQDVRGRGTSEGEFDLFAHEVEDGRDTIEWAAELPRSTGAIGMYGFSYQGMTQLYAAMAQPAALKTLCPAMIGYDLYTDWAYEGGAFCLQGNLGWAIQLSAETARRWGQALEYETLYAAARNLPLSNAVDAQSGLLRELAPRSHYHDWLSHPHPDDYWDALSPAKMDAMQSVDLPMLHIGSWFDPYLRGTLRFHQEMASRSQHPQHLWVGPWGHLPWGSVVGSVNYGDSASSPIDRLQIRWFDHFLKGQDSGILAQAPVHWFELGSDRWRAFPERPAPAATSWYLQSDGLASMDLQSGQLSADRPTETAHCPDTWVHDPWRPVPSQGGHASIPSGSFDRSNLDCRSDVVTYTSSVQTEDLHLAGTPEAELYCMANAPSFDLCAVLSDVAPDGKALNLSQGYLRINAAEFDNPHQQTPQRFLVQLQTICARIPAGHALRLSVSGACAPAYAVNAGTGTQPGESQLLDAKVITIALHCDRDYASALHLPIVPADPL